MGLMDEISQALSAQVAGKVGQAGQERIAALMATRALMPEADVYDRIRLARYILTGNEEPPEVIAVQTMSGETVAEYVVPKTEPAKQQPLTGVVGPDPEFEKALAAETVEEIAEGSEPAPSAGKGWAGHRGG